MPRELAADETIKSVWNYLTNQRPYVSGVRREMLRCEKQHGNAHVRIGVTGTGQRPYYRVFYRSPEGTDVIFNSYYDNHEALEDGFALTGNWSTASMSISEVSELMAEKFNLKSKL